MVDGSFVGIERIPCIHCIYTYTYRLTYCVLFARVPVSGLCFFVSVNEYLVIMSTIQNTQKSPNFVRYYGVRYNRRRSRNITYITRTSKNKLSTHTEQRRDANIRSGVALPERCCAARAHAADERRRLGADVPAAASSRRSVGARAGQPVTSDGS